MQLLSDSQKNKAPGSRSLTSLGVTLLSLASSDWNNIETKQKPCLEHSVTGEQTKLSDSHLPPLTFCPEPQLTMSEAVPSANSLPPAKICLGSHSHQDSANTLPVFLPGLWPTAVCLAAVGVICSTGWQLLPQCSDHCRRHC